MEEYNFWCSKYKLFNGNEQLYEWAHPNLSTLDQVYHQPQIYQGSKESKVFLTKYEYWKKPVGIITFLCRLWLEQAFTKKEKKAIKLITQKLKTIGLHSQFNGRKTGHFL